MKPSCKRLSIGLVSIPSSNNSIAQDPDTDKLKLEVSTFNNNEDAHIKNLIDGQRSYLKKKIAETQQASEVAAYSQLSGLK
jgi:hypothetical protein